MRISDAPTVADDREWILSSLRGFENDGFSWSASLSVGEYLRQLARLTLILPAVAESVAKVYAQSRYGGVSSDGVAIQRAIDELAEARQKFWQFESNHQATLRREWDQVVAPVPVSPSTASGNAAQPQLVGTISSDDAWATRANSDGQPDEKRWDLRLLGVLAASSLLIWSTGVGALTYYTHDSIESSLFRPDLSERPEVAAETYPYVVHVQSQLQALRRKPASLWQLIDRSWKGEDLADAIVEFTKSYGSEVLEFEAALSNLQFIYLQQRILSATDDPVRTRLIFECADLYWKREEYRRAISLYAEGLEKTPDDPERLHKFAWLLLTAQDPSFRDPPRALAAAERAYALWTTPVTLYALAEAHFQNGDFDKARELQAEVALGDAQHFRGFHRRQQRKFQSTQNGAGPPLPTASQPQVFPLAEPAMMQMPAAPYQEGIMKRLAVGARRGRTHQIDE